MLCTLATSVASTVEQVGVRVQVRRRQLSFSKQITVKSFKHFPTSTTVRARSWIELQGAGGLLLSALESTKQLSGLSLVLGILVTNPIKTENTIPLHRFDSNFGPHCSVHQKYIGTAVHLT